MRSILNAERVLDPYIYPSRISKTCIRQRKVRFFPSATSPNRIQEQWDNLTDRLVASSAIPFSILVLPQVVQNTINICSGQAASLSIISWEGYLSGLLGNTLMCTHFAGRGERSAVNVQIIGIINNMLVLFQVALVSFMPVIVFTATAVATALAVGVSLARLGASSRPQEDEKLLQGKMSNWVTWQLLVGMAGFVIFPQVLMSSLMLPGQGAVGLLACLVFIIYFLFKARSSESKAELADTARSLPGWAATLLFALSPLPQLVRNFVEPSSLEGLSVGTMVLALTGNALMFPRALFTRDIVWMAGTGWACTAGWGQLLSMYLGKSSVTGESYLSLGLFAIVSILMLVFATWALSNDSGTRSSPKLT